MMKRRKKRIYADHFPIVSSRIKGDNELLQLLDLGKQMEYPLLIYFVDAYTRNLTQNIYNMGFCIQTWAEQHLRIQSPKMIQITTCGVRTFFRSIIPRIQFQPMIKVNDNLAEICEYVSIVCEFFQAQLQNKYWKAPFHMDLIVAVNSTASCFEDDDSSDRDHEYKHKDDIDIISRLKTAHCVSVCNSIDVKQSMNVLSLTYNEYEYQLQLLKSSQTDIFDEYPNKNRFCIFVDRRDKYKDNLTDSLIIFGCPGCPKIAPNAGHEWHLNSLLNCLIPNKNHKKNL
eukprot:28011_1